MLSLNDSNNALFIIFNLSDIVHCDKMNHPNFTSQGITPDFSDIDLKVQNRSLNDTNDL
jgi:hypothetical protein